MTIEIKKMYRCNECYWLHELEDDALECCPRIEERYLCPVCNADHPLIGNALDCCGFDPEGPAPLPSAAELEAHGQLRLCQ